MSFTLKSSYQKLIFAPGSPTEVLVEVGHVVLAWHVVPFNFCEGHIVPFMVHVVHPLVHVVHPCGARRAPARRAEVQHVVHRRVRHFSGASGPCPGLKNSPNPHQYIPTSFKYLSYQFTTQKR